MHIKSIKHQIQTKKGIKNKIDIKSIKHQIYQVLFQPLDLE